MKKWLLLSLFTLSLLSSRVWAGIEDNYKHWTSTEIIVGAPAGSVHLSTTATVYLKDYTVLSTGSTRNKLEFYDTSESTTAGVTAGVETYLNFPTGVLDTYPLDIFFSSACAAVLKNDPFVAGEETRVRIRYAIQRFYEHPVKPLNP